MYGNNSNVYVFVKIIIFRDVYVTVCEIYLYACAFLYVFCGVIYK